MKYILSGIAFAVAVTARAGPYERCGGKGWYGPTECAAGFSCQVSNEYYSQCVPLPFKDDGTRSGPYGQCGGKTWNGTTICLDGYRCLYVNDWYSQCVLDGAYGTGSVPTTLATLPAQASSSGVPSTKAPLTKASSTKASSTEAASTEAASTKVPSTKVPSTKASSTKAPSTTRPASHPLWKNTTSSALGTTTSRTSTPVSSIAPTSTATEEECTGKLKWLGVVESGAEFGPDKFPGVEGTDYTFPDENAINVLIKKGYNIFRIPFAMERMVAPSVSSPLQSDYLKGIKQTVELITKQGKHAILDAHNYGRYNGNTIDTKAFQTFWKNLAGAFRDNANVIFDINNEYHDMEQTLVLQLNQAGINGIREAGATTQYILAEGNSYSGTRTWVSTNDNLKNLVDPQNKLIYEMHQYLDQDGSGKSSDCQSGTVGAERLTSATKWLRDNNKLGVVGEFAAGANEQCKEAVKGMLTFLEDNSDVWMGALFWGGGPWWHDYMFSFEPPNGIAYKYYDEVLTKYLP
ncbi:hypothetical protein E4U42_004298 [Claviceps africana]|uniref:cellulase n=1 Tax=Claviceps africana TaxID=83212 RepID=A0A8K0J621_9HYPO|nr:hypothetical protein E4U42_004298 [Claviceps africana]